MVRYINKLDKMSKANLMKLSEKMGAKNGEGEEEAEPETKLCPYCLSEIPYKATRCSHCTSELKKEVNAE